MALATTNSIPPPSQIAIIGGTFDTLHQGHKEYIKTAFDFAEKVNIFLRTDKYAQDCKTYQVKPYRKRFDQVKKFIEEIGCQTCYKILPIDSENTLINFCLNNPSISLTVLGPEYYSLFEEINKKREQKGLKSLLILIKQRACTPDGHDINSTKLNGKNNHVKAEIRSQSITSL